MRNPTILCCFAVWILAAAPCAAQISAPAQPSREIEVSLELRRAPGWETIDPQSVLRLGDVIRFRFRSASGGHLYVFSVSSAGEGVWLFPRPAQGQMNSVEPRTEYVIPGLNGSFVVGGSPGFDIVYWVVSRVSLDTQIKPQRGTQPSTLRPRCREGPLKARGLCLDDRAGASAVQDIGNLPFEWSDADRQLLSRDLTFRSEDGLSRVTAHNENDGILVYQFRIAHQ